MLALGFAAGLPLILLLGTLSFWLREAGVDRKTIGHLSWIGLAYAFKWLWSPLVDRLPIPLLTAALGRRRSWLLLSQALIVGALICMAMTDPKLDLMPMVWAAVVLAFASATQDVALDAFRIESAEVDAQPALAASYLIGYRVAMIWAGAGVLWLAARAEVSDAANYQYAAWQFAYLVMAASMLVGMVTVLFSKEPAPLDKAVDASERKAVATNFATNGLVFSWPLVAALLGIGGLLSCMILAARASDLLYPVLQASTLLAILGCLGLDQGWGVASPLRLSVPAALAPALAWLHAAVFSPFADFVRRYRRQALLILALIATYRISDIVMGIMANPFYVDMGYTKDEVATVSKLYGVIMTLVGAFLGGIMSVRFGVMRVLMLGAILSAATNLLFAWLASQGHNVTLLIWVISCDNLSSGIATAAFIAYLSALTNVKFSATQYAMFSSVMLLLPKFIAGFSGGFVNSYGYPEFFTATALLGVPVLLLVWLAGRAKLHSDAPKP
jgi:PAT family beta-lactamase induction signal transducer AmpG